jgi:hypothetical protein
MLNADKQRPTELKYTILRVTYLINSTQRLGYRLEDRRTCGSNARATCCFSPKVKIGSEDHPVSHKGKVHTRTAHEGPEGE